MDGIDRRTVPARLRPCAGLETEIPALWAVQDAARDADGEIERNSLQGFANYYRHLERCDPARDLIVAEVDGRSSHTPGWSGTITRRPWRKRGLARALIARSLAVLREQGLDDAYLGVDLTNANQALALYESCGFEVLSGATAYRKPLPTLLTHQPEEAPS